MFESGAVSDEVGESHVLVRRLFLSGLGLVYLFAFASLWWQVDGLFGRRGILPAQEFLDNVQQRTGTIAWGQVPTLAWLTGAGNSALHLYCAAGVVSGLALLAGVLPFPAAVSAWAAYLSLVSVGRDFLRFQWDSLLLECGFLAILYAPMTAIRWNSPAWTRQPPLSVTWLLRLLIGKLMFLSGVVKLSGGDSTWWNLTALTHHYETTCLPTWSGWFAHQLPGWFHKLSAVGMFAVELLGPLLLLAPAPFRVLAAVSFSGLMLFIGATGNYGFFNLLVLVLCIPVLDDDQIPWQAPALPNGPTGWATRVRNRICAWIAVVIVVLSSVPLVHGLHTTIPLPSWLSDAYERLSPWHIVNGYGLFAHMTTQRPEIVVEGSLDGKEWRTYEFRWKPGDPSRRPDFVQPHMPRLDWQMWFAALGAYQRNSWYLAFCQRLLEGSPEVVALLSVNPFPDQPPRYLRSTLYDYRFSPIGAPTWWSRQRMRPYMPTVALDGSNQGKLRIAGEIEP